MYAPKRAQARHALGIEGAALHNRRLGDPHPGADGLDDHPGRALHPRTSKPERPRRLDAEPAQPAMEIPERRAAQQFADARQQGVADAAPEKRHRAGVDPPGEAVAEHEVMPLAQLVQEDIERARIVLPVAVSENRVTTGRRLDAGDDRIAVSRPRLMHDPRSGRARHGSRTVATAVVHDHDFAGCLPAFQEPRRLAHAMRYRLLLVATEDKDRQLQLAGARREGGKRRVIARFGCGPAGRRRSREKPHGSRSDAQPGAPSAGSCGQRGNRTTKRAPATAPGVAPGRFSA